jgi:isopentenyl diphosphate isomerase/L-lactate dehydrogenase-like FMN-dependent dehydrogenase
MNLEKIERATVDLANPIIFWQDIEKVSQKTIERLEDSSILRVTNMFRVVKRK